MTNKTKDMTMLSEKQEIAIAAQFDGEASSGSLNQEPSSVAVKSAMERLTVTKEFLHKWFQSRFTDSQGNPYQATLWEKIESALNSNPQRERSLISKIFGDYSLRWFDLYPREITFASGIAIGVFAVVVGYGVYDSKLRAQAEVAQLLSSPIRESSYNEYDLAFNSSLEQPALRGDYLRLVDDSKPLALRPKSNMHRKTYSEVHAGTVDIDWINSDRSVSILNAGSAKTPPVIWIGKKKFEID